MPQVLAHADDMFERFSEGTFIGRDRHQSIPLKSTRFSVSTTGPLAIVTIQRVFLNNSSESVEVTHTFPVPTYAVLTNLEFVIGERRLVARCQLRKAARETYEQAIDDGKTAVLHEELIRGVHMLSCGHIPPGTEVRVESTYVLALEATGDRLGLRIPLTVGDIYGRSPLKDSDDIVSSTVTQRALVSITAETGTPTLQGHPIGDTPVEILLDRPLQIEIVGWQPREIVARAADGRRVRLNGEIRKAGADPLRLALLIDRSGSMGEGVPEARTTKHGLLKRDLAGLELRAEDVVDVWEFDDDASQVPGETFRRRIANLGDPRGGTQIGKAVREVVRAGSSDLLILTDGQSHDIDPQRLSDSAARISAILVGRDSLEAHVGHLAALTGGCLFAVPGTGMVEVIADAIAFLRTPKAERVHHHGKPASVKASVSGLDILATWDEASEVASENQAAAGFAAYLGLGGMTNADAEAWALAHNLVCHLTSLVLVDQEGKLQDGLPNQHKIPLMQSRQRGGRPLAAAPAMDFMVAAPRAAMAAGPAPVAASVPRPAPMAESAPSPTSSSGRWLFRRKSSGLSVPPPMPPQGFASLAHQLDWSRGATRYLKGDLSSVTVEQEELLVEAANLAAVRALAKATGKPAIAVLFGLLASLDAANDRAAERLVRAIFGSVDPALVKAALRATGLQS